LLFKSAKKVSYRSFVKALLYAVLISGTMFICSVLPKIKNPPEMGGFIVIND
jgi:hypothetical protein